MPSPLARAWSTLTRYPALALVPMLWDAFAVLLASLPGTLPAAPGVRPQFHVKFTLPPSLPGGSDLLPNPAGQLGVAPVAGPLVLVLALGVLGALVKAGYLHLLRQALAGAVPTPAAFREGVFRYGGRMAALALLLFVLFLAAAPLGMRLGPLVLLGLVLLLAFYLTDFLIVAEDLSLAEALRQAPRRLTTRLGDLGGPLVASLLISAAVTLVLSLLGLLTEWVASPVWGFLGTWLALAVMDVLAGRPAHGGQGGG